jgi:hypothetical protein
MKNNKKVIKLRESELIDLIERIVNEVKITEKQSIKETKRSTFRK